MDKTPECDGRTDGQTDGQNISGYYSGRHFEQCRRVVKTTVNCQLFQFEYFTVKIHKYFTLLHNIQNLQTTCLKCRTITVSLLKRNNNMKLLFIPVV